MKKFEQLILDQTKSSLRILQDEIKQLELEMSQNRVDYNIAITAFKDSMNDKQRTYDLKRVLHKEKEANLHEINKFLIELETKLEKPEPFGF